MNRIFLLALLTVTAPTFAKATRPNIILVMADDQGYGDAGYTGHPFVQTPNLDAMSQKSIVFNRFYAGSPVCSPTRASIMTGRTAMRTNVLNHGHYMRPHEITLPEAMKKAGYVTGHFGKWHIGSIQVESPTAPGNIGFDESLTAINFFDENPYLAENGEIKKFTGQGSTITMDATIDFIKKHKDGQKPIFAMTWFPAPHDPHKEVPVDYPGAKKLYKTKEAGNLRGYFLEITLLDQELGKLRKALRDMNIADNTIVWYCSDNGGLDKRTSGGRAKKGSIYEGGLRIPSLIEWPAKFKHKEINVTASTADIYPTILSIAKVKMDNQPKLDGINLKSIITGKKTKRPAIGFWHLYEGGQACQSDKIMRAILQAKEAGEKNPWESRIMKTVDKFPRRDKNILKGHAAWNQWPYKLHRIEKKNIVRIELYNLEKDPMETTDLSKKDKVRATAMLKELEAWQRDVLGSLEGDDYHSKEVK